MGEVLEFTFRTGRFSLDYNKCEGCTGFYCVKACSLYGRNLLRIRDGRPVIFVSPEEAGRICVECLACEVECALKGKGAIRIELPIQGLDEYRAKWGVA